MLRRQRLRLRRERRVPPEGEQGGRVVLDRDHAQLFQPRPLRDGRGHLIQVDVRGPLPQCERGIEFSEHLGQFRGGEIGPVDHGTGRGGGPRAETAVRGGHGGVEPGRVDGLGGQPQGVPGRDRDEDLRGHAGGPVGLERPAQAVT